MRKLYEALSVDVVKFEAQDVITNSYSTSSVAPSYAPSEPASAESSDPSDPSDTSSVAPSF
ncbi:MAG: hypothetical protein Q4C76_00105 [Bacillota bacterium]|nr:hypothetical protein [Bacillota bacterium]